MQPAEHLQICGAATHRELLGERWFEYRSGLLEVRQGGLAQLQQQRQVAADRRDAWTTDDGTAAPAAADFDE